MPKLAGTTRAIPAIPDFVKQPDWHGLNHLILTAKA
jgi:hypothetical protein